MRRIFILATVVTLALCCTTASQAAILQFAAFLDGLQEVPPVATPGFGDGLLTLDDVTGDYTISGNFDSLIGTTTIAHIHGPGAPGVPAGVVHGLTIDLGVTSGKYTGADTFTSGQMTELLGGLYYVNIHTTFKTGGEIRGQLTLVPEPSSIALFAIGGTTIAGIAWRRRRRRNR